MRKRNAIVTLAIAALVGLGGCSTGNGDSNGSPAGAGTAGSTAGGAMSGTVSVMSWGSQEDNDSVKAIADAYAKAHPGVSIDFQIGECAIDVGVCKQLIAGGTMPDVVIPHNSTVPQLADLNVLEPLDDLMARDGVDAGQFVPAAMSGVTYHDSVYALPMGYHIEALYYNQDLFDKAGLAYPPADGSYTYDQLREWARALTVDKSGKTPNDDGFDPESIVQWGLYNWPMSLNGYDPILLANGGSVTDLDGSPTCTIESPEAINTFKFIQDLIWTDHVAVSPQADQEQAGKYRFAEGQVAMLMGAHWMTSIIQAQAPDLPNDVAALPKGDEANASIVNVHSWGVYQGSKAKDLAWDFVKWASTDGAAPAMGLIPANNSIMDSGFLGQPNEPEHLADAFVTPASWPLTVSPPEFGKSFAEISGQDGLAPIMEDIYYNTKPADEALAGACDRIQPFLDE